MSESTASAVVGYRVRPHASGADTSVHVWSVVPLGRFGANQATTLCPPGAYGVTFSNRTPEHPDLDAALSAAAQADHPCPRCTAQEESS